MPPTMPLAVLLLLLVAGCGVPRPLVGVDESVVREDFVARRWLSTIQDGSSTRDEIIRLLGPPTQTFQGGGIHVYRLILVEPKVSADEYRLFVGGVIPRRPVVREEYLAAYYDEWLKRLAERGTLNLGREAEYSLVLVFDQTGVLRTHRLLRVRP